MATPPSMAVQPESAHLLADDESQIRQLSGLQEPANSDNPTGPDGSTGAPEFFSSAHHEPASEEDAAIDAIFLLGDTTSSQYVPRENTLDEPHQEAQKEQSTDAVSAVATKEDTFQPENQSFDLMSGHGTVNTAEPPQNLFDGVDIGAMMAEDPQGFSVTVGSDTAFSGQNECVTPTKDTKTDLFPPTPPTDTCVAQSSPGSGAENGTKVEEGDAKPAEKPEQPKQTPEQPKRPKQPEPYMWDSPRNLTHEQHIAVMEEAVEAAIRSGSQLVSILGRAANMQMPVDAKKWTAEFEAICQEHKAFRVRIGLVGATGAGKTTILNALLDHDELLPSGCEGAATGVPCTVRHSRDMDSPFRAEIKFCSRRAVLKWLQPILEDLRDRHAPYESASENEEGAEQEAEKEEEDLFVKQTQEDDNQDFGMTILKPIYAIWKYDEDTLRDMTAEELIDSDEDIARLLSSKKVVSGDNLQDFSLRIRPYLDCTAHPDLTGPDGEEVELWPLVERVDVFVAAPILENGVELQDLPGLGDSVALRAERAQENLRSQDIMVVVTPAVRASDEKVAGDLISENQAVRMQMDGKLDRHALCVVTSKVDDQKWDAYASRDLRSDEYSNVHETFAMSTQLRSKTGLLSLQIQQKKRIVEELHASCEVAECAQDQIELRKSKAELENAQVALSRLVQRRDAVAKLHRYYRGRLAFQCGQVRNQRIREKLQTSFRMIKKRLQSGQSRRQGGKKYDNGDDDDDDDITVLPVSARAYWDLALQHGDEDAHPGFPDVTYTGVPALRKWLRHATIPARKTHAQALLHRLQVLLGPVSTLFKDEPPRQLKSNEERRILLDTVILPFLHTLEENLRVCSPVLAGRVERCNPLTESAPAEGKNGKKKRTQFRLRRGNEIRDLVKSWVYRYPKDPEKYGRAKVNWATQRAILVRNGGLYTCGGADRVTYSWIRDMGSCVLLEVLDRWNDSFQQRLPEEAKHAREVLAKVWDTSLLKVRKLLPSYFPDEREFLGQQLKDILAIRDLVTNEVQSAMFAIAEQAKAIHPGVEGALQKSWSNTFKKAKGLSGRGVVMQRQGLLEHFASTNTTKVVKRALNEMATKIQKTTKGFDKTLEAICAGGMQKTRDQVEALLRQIGGGPLGPTSGADDGNAAVRATDLRQEAKAVLTRWQDDWTVPDVLGRMAPRAANADIPEDYVVEPAEDETADVWSDSDGEDGPPPKTRPAARGRMRQPRKRPATGNAPAAKRRRGPAAEGKSRKPRASRKPKEATE